MANHYYYYYLLAATAIAFVAAASLLLLQSSFAQINNATQLGNTTQMNATGTNAPPVLHKISDKGIYNVTLIWPQTVSDAQNSLQVEIDFYNASAPPPTKNTIPEREGNATGGGTEAGLTVPGSIGGEPLPVKSYNMTIYSADGKKLWEKQDQPGIGGRGTQRIVLESKYTGPVTVDISDITPGWNVGQGAAASDMIDSVKFAATIVPEFPVATVLLAIGITASIAALGCRRRLI
ncbi:MAG TPA: hypothetical protein VE692_01255 [Nitrososphaera sp.]|nr:hypothetical protein [Nitrososphaera sp.]